MNLYLSNSHASEISLKKLQHLELMEDIVDLAKKVVVSGGMCISPCVSKEYNLYGVRPMLLIYSG